MSDDEQKPHLSDLQGGTDKLNRLKKEDEYWESRRARRERLAIKGCADTWARSPTHSDLQRIYQEHEKMARRLAKDAKKADKMQLLEKNDKKRKRKYSKSSTSSSSSSDERHKRKKKSKKSKKDKKKRKESSISDAEFEVKMPANVKKEDNDEEWVELTHEIREKQAQKAREEEAQIIGPQIPDFLVEKHKAEMAYLDAEARKYMLSGEAAAMSAYIAQGKRIPRRGEIGLNSDEISEFEKAGYIMSGTRHKTMETTRLRKENQIMTAEEKRLLSGLTLEQRKQKEEIIMKQFQSLVDSKRGT